MTRLRWPGWKRLGLRSRATAATALAVLLVTGALSGIAYGLVRSYLLGQRENVTERQAFTNAVFVRDSLRSPSLEPGKVLEQVQVEPGAFAFLLTEGKWYGKGVGVPLEALPAGVQQAAVDGGAGRATFSVRGRPYLAVAVGLPSAQAAYVEVFPLVGLARTLEALRNSLLIGAAVSGAAGALVGYWSSRRVLDPVTQVAEAADALAHGGLDTRLGEEPDPDLQRLVDSFNHMADSLQARIAREARFASDASHELRTPLAALTAAAEVLSRRRGELPDRAGQALDVLLSQLSRFRQLVLDLLEFSRMDAGVADVHLEPARLDELVPKIAAAGGFGEIPIEILAGGAARPLLAMVDKRRMESVVLSLLDNAAAHAGGATRLTVAADEDDASVLVIVDDDGPGVPEGERTRVFERFARGRAASSRPGSGLGLALVAEHVRLQGGGVGVETGPSGGARFVVRLPLAQEFA